MIENVFVIGNNLHEETLVTPKYIKSIVIEPDLN